MAEQDNGVSQADWQKRWNSRSPCRQMGFENAHQLRLNGTLVPGYPMAALHRPMPVRILYVFST